MENTSTSFKAVKYSYITVLVLIITTGVVIIKNSHENHNESNKSHERYSSGPMVTGLLIMAFGVSGLIGALKENVAITAVILVLSVFGGIGLLILTMSYPNAILLGFLVAQLLFISLVYVFMRMIAKHRDSTMQTNVRFNRVGVQNGGNSVHNTMPPPYYPIKL